MQVLKFSLLMISLISIFPRPSLAQTVNMSNNWEQMNMTQDGCLNSAKQAMSQAGFSEALEVVANNSVFARYRGYLAVARCVAEKQIVFFAVSGPSADVTAQFADRLKQEFNKLNWQI